MEVYGDYFWLQLDTVLLNTYEYMQKYAVGLEQIVWDQEDFGLQFRTQFKDTEFKLRTVSFLVKFAKSIFCFESYFTLIFIFMGFDLIKARSESKGGHDFHNST